MVTYLEHLENVGLGFGVPDVLDPSGPSKCKLPQIIGSIEVEAALLQLPESKKWSSPCRDVFWKVGRI